MPTVIVMVLAAGLGWVFQPWTLFLDHRVAEAMPGQLTTVRSSAAPSAAATTAAPSSNPAGSTPQPSIECACDVPPAATTGPDGAGRTVLRTGFFIAQGRPTSGAVSVIQLPDGRRFLRIQDLDTRNGPALRVWLSTESARIGQDTWASFAEAEHRDLGRLKGNLGDQNYEIAADVDLALMVTVTIWSERYSVSYGAASLQR